MSQIWCILCLVCALVKKRNLCFHSPTGVEVSCDPYYGVNLLWCGNGSQHGGLIHFLFMTALDVVSPGQQLEKQTISGVVLFHSDITVCDCSEDESQLRGRPWHSERHIQPRFHKKYWSVVPTRTAF